MTRQTARLSLERPARAALILVLVALILWGSSGALAQDDAAARIQSAYADYETWQTYYVQAEVTAWSAIVANGAYGSGRSLWRRQERSASITGWYDRSAPDNVLISLNVNGDAELSVEQDGTETPSSWAVNMDVAMVNGALNWRGEFETDPASDFALPAEWESFAATDLNQVPAFADLTLSRLLGQENLDPFVGDYLTWLEQAESIEGPEQIKVGREATGDVYTVTLPLSAAPELIGSRINLLTEGPQAVIGRDVLMAQLEEDGVLIWRVVIDPATGQLIGQELQGEVNSELGGDALAEPFTSLSVAYNERQSVLFASVNQPSEMPDVSQSGS